MKESILRIELLIDIINKYFDGIMDTEKLKSLDYDETPLIGYKISKSAFKKYITDMVDIEKFDLYENNDIINEKNSYITIFDTDIV